MIDTVRVEVSQCDSPQHAIEEIGRALQGAFAAEIQEDIEANEGAPITIGHRIGWKSSVLELVDGEGWKGRAVGELIQYDLPKTD